MKKAFTLTLLIFWFAISTFQGSGIPQIEISNGLIKARLYLPDSQNGYYRGTRFDWLAADRVGIELMGIDFAKIGYLQHYKQMKPGNDDLAKIEIVGENLKDHIKQYKLPNNFDRITGWMNPKT